MDTQKGGSHVPMTTVIEGLLAFVTLPVCLALALAIVDLLRACFGWGALASQDGLLIAPQSIFVPC
jgi:hypothetical protein